MGQKQAAYATVLLAGKESALLDQIPVVIAVLDG
jgi:hypothetical protein